MAETIKAFNKWSTEGIVVEDPGIKEYICIEPRIVPRSGARYAGNRFHKSKVFIIERFMNKIMVPGHKGKKHYRTSYKITGKAHKAYTITEEVLLLVEKKLKKNPVEVFVKAVENCAQREEIITIEYGGARYPKAVECAPQRRIDMVLRHFTQGAYHKAFNSKKGIVECLADEIINAYQGTQNSQAITKKLEVERQADASR